MLTKEEIQSAEMELKFVMDDELMKECQEYHAAKARREREDAIMEKAKTRIQARVEELGARGLIDPETGRSMVTYSEQTRQTADKKLMIEELGEEVVDMYFKTTSFSRMTIR